jgi:hypothetical protein
MRPVEHFLSKLDRVSSAPWDDRTRLRFERDFGALVAPVLGAAVAADLYNRTLDRPVHNAAPHAALRKLGCMAAFFLGEYDEATMPLEKDDWDEIRGTLEDVSGEIDLTTLTALMGELLSRGALD